MTVLHKLLTIQPSMFLVIDKTKFLTLNSKSRQKIERINYRKQVFIDETHPFLVVITSFHGVTLFEISQRALKFQIAT